MKAKFLISIILVLVVLAEQYVQQGWLYATYSWTIGFMAWYNQALVLATATILVAGAAAVFFRGWIGIPILAVAAVLPVLNIDLGLVDEQLGDLARYLATNPRNVREVAQIYWWLHAGVMAAIPVAIALTLLWGMRRMR
jgi:hypothetical protein